MQGVILRIVSGHKYGKCRLSLNGDIVFCRVSKKCRKQINVKQPASNNLFFNKLNNLTEDSFRILYFDLLQFSQYQNENLALLCFLFPSQHLLFIVGLLHWNGKLESRTLSFPHSITRAKVSTSQALKKYLLNLMEIA